MREIEGDGGSVCVYNMYVYGMGKVTRKLSQILLYDQKNLENLKNYSIKQDQVSGPLIHSMC